MDYDNYLISDKSEIGFASLLGSNVCSTHLSCGFGAVHMYNTLQTTSCISFDHCLPDGLLYHLLFLVCGLEKQTKGVL